MAINYDIASNTYDNTRKAEDSLIEMICKEVDISRKTKILDFGCGTGNYLSEISNRFMAKCYGVDPSEGMLEKAKRKNPSIVFKIGSHKIFPFEDQFFDLIYMTDVIHHIPNLDRLFGNLYSKIDTNGRICILTESHEQIETRWYNEFFPSLLMNEKVRYPDIEEIKKCTEQNGLVNYKNNIRLGSPEVIVDDNFIRMVEEKNYQYFWLVPDMDLGAIQGGL